MKYLETVRRLGDTELGEFARTLYENNFLEFNRAVVELVRGGEMRDYESIAVIFAVLPFHAEGKWYNGETCVEQRYMNMFISACTAAGCKESEYIAVLLAAQYARRGGLLSSWDGGVDMYLTARAKADYERIADYIDKYDKKFGKYGVLLTVDRKKTIARLLDKVLYGKNIDKTAVRDVLIDCEDVVSELTALYEKSDAHLRAAIVRLLLLYKNNTEACEFIKTRVSSDPSKSVRELLKAANSARKVSAPKFFENLMVEGRPLSYADWIEKLKDKDFAAVADKTFFGIRTVTGATGVFVYNNGHFLDMSDRKVKMDDKQEIFVIHPLDVPAHAHEILTAKITQPFLQVGRPIFHQLAGEDNNSFRVYGAMISRAEFDINFKRGGFVFCDKRSEAEPDCALRRIGDYCIGVECDISGDTVSGGNITFYAVSDIIKLNRKIYINAAAPLACRNVPRREFSELIYAAYKLFDCL